MTDPPTGKPGAESRVADNGPGVRSPGAALPWPRRQKVAVPDRKAGYFHRPELVERHLPTRHSVTILRAPAGFGKTTLLAECCRSEMAQGVLTAWLSIDKQDGPTMLETHLSLAFRHAGLDVAEGAIAVHDERRLPGRIGPLLQAIEALDGPCVLALDEVERLADAESVALVNFLLERAPSNLHLAIACRDFPSGLDVASPILEGRAVVATAGQLRFSASETAAFLGEDESQSAEFAGWPFALRIHREQQHGGTHGMTAADVARTWLDSRMWRAVSAADRDLVLDVGLLERIEPHVLDEVLDGHGFWQRLVAMPAIDGLLLPVSDAEPEARRVHPLLQQCCVEWRRRETPERFGDLHRRMARALARRGAVVSAMRHATEGDDPDLAAAILEAAGGLRFLIREGFARLQAADGFLTPTILDRHPRLALARCLILTLTGRLEEARQSYARIAELAGGAVANAEDATQRELYLDDLFVRGVAILFSTPSWASGEVAVLRAQMADAVELPDLDPVMRSTFEYGLCVLHGMKAEFDEALARADRARGTLGTRWSYVPMLLDYQVGTIAMARGNVGDAQAWYARGERALRIDSRHDRGPTLIGEVLMRELELERNYLTYPPEPVPLPNAFDTACSPFQVYAAASAAVVELTLEQQGVIAALVALQEMLDHSHRGDLPSVSRYLSAMSVGTLAAAGRHEEAERTWRLSGLPDNDVDCLDLEAQTWREMEAIAEARLKILRARKEFDAARAFSSAVVQTVEQRGLRRTRMRCLALSITIEVAADDRPAAAAHLAAFVRLFTETDYARPLVRERDVVLPLLEDYVDGGVDPEFEASACALRDHLRSAAARGTGVRLAGRSLDVLQRLEKQHDREIAQALGITHAGVRYHVRTIFEQLNARSRMDAVHRARSIGLLPEPQGPVIHQASDRGVSASRGRRP